MKVTAHRSDRRSYAHSVQIRDHRLIIDEPKEQGGGDTGPAPQELLAASLAGCVAITMEMYAQRKGWDIGEIAVSVEYLPPTGASPTRLGVNLFLPSECTEEQRERLRVIATKCPIHRLLAGEVVFEERLTIVEPHGER